MRVVTTLARGSARLLNIALGRFGVELRQVKEHDDLADQEVWRQVRRFTATSKARVQVLCDAVEHVVRNNIEGAFVECGVWRGGSTMAAALTFMSLGDTERELHLFDTFSGMPPPSEDDREISTGKPAVSKENGKPVAYASLEEVKHNMALTGYDMGHVRFHQGMVEDTVPKFSPSKIAILRLDTDWYASTKHELEHLWPLIVTGGFLIIDDYGHFTGAKKATDEFFQGKEFLFRIDYTGRLVVKR